MAEQVTLFVRPGCPECEAARQFLVERQVAFAEVDVMTAASALRELTRVSGQSLVPTLVFGDDVQVGWDAGRFEAMFANPLAPRDPPLRIVIDENEELTF
jgi:glutaredoxin 3